MALSSTVRDGGMATEDRFSRAATRVRASLTDGRRRGIGPSESPIEVTTLHPPDPAPQPQNPAADHEGVQKEPRTVPQGRLRRAGRLERPPGHPRHRGGARATRSALTSVTVWHSHPAADRNETRSCRRAPMATEPDAWNMIRDLVAARGFDGHGIVRLKRPASP